jgi:two-component system nitrate/nitrite response regulator NarL
MPPTSPISLVLVDDHKILLDGIKSFLTADPEFHVVAAVHTAADALKAVDIYKPQILLTDYSLPDSTGLDLFRLVKSKFPDTKVAVLSMHDEPSIVNKLLKEGINGYLLKTIHQAELKIALLQISEGNLYVSPEITRMLLNQLNNPEQKNTPLTDRELEILKLITQEFSNKQIADKLFISERTVETHRKNILRKTNTTSIVGLIKFAFEKQVI